MSDSDSALVLKCGHPRDSEVEIKNPEGESTFFCKHCNPETYELLLIKREEEIKKKVEMEEITFWAGATPIACDICKGPFTDKVFFDTHLPHQTRWGLFCYSCFASLGCEIGAGKGQRYDLETKRKLEG